MRAPPHPTHGHCAHPRLRVSDLGLSGAPTYVLYALYIHLVSLSSSAMPPMRMASVVWGCTVPTYVVYG